MSIGSVSGERSRLSIARALLSGRPIVLLDEPTAHLDDATADLAIGGLLGAPGSAGRTFVLVSHRPGDPDSWETVDLSARPTDLAPAPSPVEGVPVRA